MGWVLESDANISALILMRQLVYLVQYLAFASYCVMESEVTA